MLGESVDWDVNTYLLAKIAHIVAGANWQRGGGKGPKPKPIKPPTGKPRRSKRDRRADGMRRMRNLGLMPGQSKPPLRPLDAQGQALLAAIERSQASGEREVVPHTEPSPLELQKRIDRLAGHN